MLKALAERFVISGDSMNHFRLWLAAVLISAGAVGCAATSGVFPYHEAASSFQADMRVRHADDSVSSGDSGDAPVPIATGTILPLPSFPMHNHQLTLSEASALIDPSLSPNSVAKLLTFLTNMTLTNFDPAASFNQYEIALVDANTGSIIYNRADLAGSLLFTCQPTSPCGSLPITFNTPKELGYTYYSPTPSPGSGPYRRMVTRYHQAE